MGSAQKRTERFLLQFGVNLKKFFPKWSEWLSKIHDPRQEVKCEYSLPALLWLSLLMLLSGRKSRNQYNENLFNEETKMILERMFGVELPAIAHGDTLAHLWKVLNPEELEKLKTAMLRVLFRSRSLEKFRYQKHYYALAVDGTELYRWKERHCPHCLYAAVGPNKENQYYHRVLEVKLVSTCGFSLSIMTEFIENEDDTADKKQDCELKAFYRLMPKLKQMFPQLPILLLADGIYPKGPVFSMCQQYKWKYLFVLKDDVLTTVWDDFEGLMDMPPNALGVKEKTPMKVAQGCVYRWMNQLSFKSNTADQQGNKFDGTVNLIEVLSLELNTGEYVRSRGFITNLKVVEKQVDALEEMAQQRWKIENQGFDIQKHHGYALEHIYCRAPNAIKVVYQLIQIAHLINQLFIQADLLGAFKAKHTLITFFNVCLSAWQQIWSESLASQWEILKQQNFQVRWQQE